MKYQEVNHLKLKVLAAISHIIDRALDLDQALEEMLRILSGTLSMKRAAVVLEDPDSGRLVIRASYGLTDDESERGVYEIDEGVTGRIFRTGLPYYVPNIRDEPLFLDKTGSHGIEQAPVSFMGVPIILNNRAIGVLYVDRLFDRETDEGEDVEFLAVVATLISQFISLNRQFRNLKRENASLKSRLIRNSSGRYMVGRSPSMLEVQRQIEKVAPTRATVLLLGESGTGKTLIARIIHDLSDRKDFPFVKFNCAAIPENLLESELFGYEKGAFTGAERAKAGRFEEAGGGTVFLDEIGELPLGLQAKLLRILQDKEFERLGGNHTQKVDVRIVAATNKDLLGQVHRGRFREDLYYRLNVFPMEVPPLRERIEDLDRLLNHFLKKVSQAYQRRLFFTADALKLLREYEWPGNVREMENLVERLVILADHERIDRSFILPYLNPGPRSAREFSEGTGSGRKSTGSLKELERREILAALERNNWVQSKACRELGLTPRQMGYRLKKFHLEYALAQGRAIRNQKKMEKKRPTRSA